MRNVYLVTKGDGSDGDEWSVHGIFATQEAANKFAREANCFYEVEEWGVHGSTLSDEERAALLWFAHYGLPEHRAATLRNLLERLK